MAEVKTAVVDTATNLFCEDGMKPGRVVVTVPDNPKPRTERYSGNPAVPIRPATGAEIAAFDQAQAVKVDEVAGLEYDAAKLLKAKGISDLAWRLGKAPGALTAGEIAAERTRIVNIYKAL